MATKSSPKGVKHYETFLVNNPIIAHSESIPFVWIEMPYFREGQVER